MYIAFLLKNLSKFKYLLLKIERIRNNLVGSLHGTNREGTFPPGVLLDKLLQREGERVRERERERDREMKRESKIVKETEKERERV